jgi:hypothetical protein
MAMRANDATKTASLVGIGSFRLDFTGGSSLKERKVCPRLVPLSRGKSQGSPVRDQLGVLSGPSFETNTWGIRSKSPSRVTTRSPCCAAEAPIHKSLGETGVPCLLK